MALNDNKAFIPLYLNEEVVNNLFTIVVQEFVDSKTISDKNQIMLNCKVPLSEFSYELFGKYVQGDINIQIVNEFSKQINRTEISKNIERFMSLRDILIKNELLRYIEKDEPINNIHENDFVIISCELTQNPIFNYLQKLINKIEIQNTFIAYKDNDNGAETIRKLNTHIEDWKNNRCIRHFTNELCTPKTRFIIPIEYRHGIANIDYITKGKVNIMGKVINSINTDDVSFTELFGDTFLNLINEKYFSDFVSGFMNIEPLVNILTDGFTAEKNLLEILPIAIFL